MCETVLCLRICRHWRTSILSLESFWQQYSSTYWGSGVALVLLAVRAATLQKSKVKQTSDTTKVKTMKRKTPKQLVESIPQLSWSRFFADRMNFMAQSGTFYIVSGPCRLSVHSMSL